MGTDSKPIDAAREGGARGIVIEAFGGGDITPFRAEGVARAQGLELVVAWSAPNWPIDLYGDIGEGVWLRQRGIHLAGTLTRPKPGSS